MADNTQLNGGAGGDIVGMDDILGIKYQRIKLIHGADGTNDGDVSTVNPLPVTLLDNIGVAPAGLGTVALTNVAASGTSGTALSANASRRAMLFVNDADKSCYLKYGTTASASSYTRKLLPGEQWEPAGNYSGRVDAIWDAGPTGSLRVTEVYS